MKDTRPPINAEWLARMRATKPDLLRELFAMYLADEPKRLAALCDAVAKGDLELMRYQAHSLKGAAATMGMERLCDACRELEDAARIGFGEALSQSCANVEREAEAVFAVMREDSEQS
ncbi:Hpt domain-containing protein [Humidesulfovibrio sp.]|uniref:Hpt domain-containing protein n=1 Tax=Humidesulfovibrio sp. TaxID=2910988 RepID=UPI0027341FE6|nr:Hpt domain-containing protein [Humidesulfovibrio sp.]